MPAVVIDASALAAVLFNEPAGLDVAQQAQGASLLAPHLMKYEIANVAAIKVKRGIIAAAQAQAVLELFENTLIEYSDINARDVAALAVQTGLTGYDAAYLWLAQTTGAKVLTLDGDLRKAAAGLAIL